MNYVYYIFNNVRYFYNSMNPATLSGAIDVVVVEQPDGSLVSTPFHVRFGKYGVFNYDNKYVDIEINNAEIGLKMKLGENGVAFFVDKATDEEAEDEEEELTSASAISPLPDEGGGAGGREGIKRDDLATGSGEQKPLKRAARKDSSILLLKQRKQPKSSSSDESRSPSPQKRTPHPSAASRTAAALQPNPTPRQKKPLPFSSSIFSCRKNRSLPDLVKLAKANSSWAESNGEEEDDEERTAGGSGKGGRTDNPATARAQRRRRGGHSRKSTFGTMDMERLIGRQTGPSPANFFAGSSTRKVLHHSASASSPLKAYVKEPADGDQPKTTGQEDTGGECSAAGGEQQKPHNECPSEEEGKGKSKCANSSVLEEEGEREDNAAGGIHMKPIGPPPSTSELADGALSDPEMDRHSNSPKLNDTVWKWGEIPKSTKQQKEAGRGEKEGSTNKSSTRWNWLYWSSKRQEKNDEQEEGGTKKEGNQGQAKEEKGLYLQDLGNDPTKLEKYFGKRSGAMSISSNASNMDSGNGHSLGTSPCTPSALSFNDDAVAEIATANSAENLTPTIENLAATDEDLNRKNSTSSEKANGSVKNRYDSGQSGASSANELNMSDEESAIGVSVASNGPAKPPKKMGLREVVKMAAAKPKYKRSLRLSSEQLGLLNLEYGSNEARFSITTKFQGTAWCSCHIYLLRWSDKLVISDIDGTITKSDVLGHVIPAIGGTWAHSGVAELYSRIKNNGYQMIYLSSRAIGQSHYTKTYLQSIAQGSRTLPDGPVLLSPTSVLMAFRKEVIERRPEEFKIACLTDLKSLYPSGHPFFAGFGNRETDVKSYRAVGIPLERILIIDPSGMVRRADKVNCVSDYATMALDTVDYIFPPLQLSASSMAAFVDPCVQVESSEFNTWRFNPSQFDGVMDAEMEAYEERRRKRHMAEMENNSVKRKGTK